MLILQTRPFVMEKEEGMARKGYAGNEALRDLSETLRWRAVQKLATRHWLWDGRNETGGFYAE
jgi:hypothetical protein